MDILAIAALEAFTGPAEGEETQQQQQANDLQPGSDEDRSMVVAGVKRKAEGVEVSADDIDPALASEGPSSASHIQPPIQEPLPPPPPRLSASLANILSGGGPTASTLPSLAAEQHRQQQPLPLPQQQPLPPLMSSPYRTSSMPLPAPSSSSPAAASSTSPSMDMTIVYYGPPVRLSEDSGLIRCICPFDDDDGFTIQCERCFAWLHGLCVDISPETVPDIYTCPLCVSGGKIARHVEARAARLQQLRKEAEDGLRRQRMKSNATTASYASSSNLLSSDPAVPPTSELDEEYELLAKARGLAYQQSFDNNYTPTSATSYHQQPPPHRVAKPTQSPYYQREQLPVQQHTLGPSPFLHPPPQAPTILPPHQQHQLQHGTQMPMATQQTRRAGSVASNASNAGGATLMATGGAASNAKRPKSSSPGGANVPQTINNAQQPKTAKKRSSHAPQPSLPSIPQNSVLDSPGVLNVGQKDAASQQEAGLSAPPPPKKRRSASAKEKEKDASEVPPSVLAPTSGSGATNASLPSQQQASISVLKDTTIQAASQPIRKTRLAAASTPISAEGNGVMPAPSVLNKGPAPSSGLATQATAAGTGPPSGSRDAFLSEDEDFGVEDRYEPWQFEYTPINNLRYADRTVEQAVNELVEQYVDEERENLNGTLDTADERTGTTGSGRASPFGHHSRNSSARPSLLGATSHLPGIAHASRMASPIPSSGSSTPAYSSSGVASALAPPCLPLILPEPPISPSEFSNKLSVKPLATSSMSLAPPACTPFSGPTCVPSLMNPYPRPTIHGVFTSSAFNAGTLITFMHGEVISGEQYRDDPINQWHDLGVMKSHTRAISQPWDLVLDQRRFADESRFIRNGCHPNVFTKPVIIRKSRNNDTIAKKGRTPAKRKADQQKAVQEGGDFELVFGLYALQDIAKREELVLPFDWADDHVVHSLHTLLFSPSLVFPTIPTNVESETEDDGIPSTSSFTHLTATQKSQIAQCTKHLYRLSRLASQTCLTLLGTSICACEKRRDCSIAWLWKLACFSESSSARSRGTIQLEDFDLNGLRAACSSALATDDKDWVATPGVNGRMSNKKSSSRKRRADLGALIGLARGWEKPPVEPVSAIPPRLASEEVVEIDEEQHHEEEAKMHVDEAEVLQDTHTPMIERPSMDFGSAIQEDTIVNSVPTSAEVDKADIPFQFAPPEAVEHGSLQSSAPIREEEIKPDMHSLAAPEEQVPEVSPMSTRPNTAQSATSEKRQSASKTATIAHEQDSDSDSDITEPLPSDHSDNEEQIKKPARKSPVKEMSKKLAIEKRKNSEDTAKNSRSSPSKHNNMQLDDEEVVRPPKKKKLLTKVEAEKPSRAKPLQKAKKLEEEEDKTPGKKLLKPKVKPAKSGDSSIPRERPSSGGLPSFRTKKQVDQAKELAALKVQEDVNKPAEIAQAVSASAVAPATSAIGASTSAAPSQLDSLFDLPVPAVVSQPKAVASGPAEIPSEAMQAATKTPKAAEAALPANASKPEETIAVSDAMQVDTDTNAMNRSEDAQASATPIETATAVVVEEKPPVPAAPAVRRVSFQAYKKRVSVVAPGSSALQESIAEEPLSKSPATVKPAALSKTPTLSLKPELLSGAMLGGDIVETPVAEKTAAQAEDTMQKPPADAKASPVIEASPAAAQSPLQATTTVPAAAAKPRLSFAAYRQRASTGPKPLPVVASPSTVPTPLVAPASLPPNTPAGEVVEQKVVEDSKATLKPVLDTNQTEIRQPNRVVEANPSNFDAKMEDEEQEEGEVVVDPNLEPGEVEADSAREQSETALGMRMGDFQQPEVPVKVSNIKQSYTPPSRHRSLTPPKPVFARQTEERPVKVDDAHQARPGTAHNAPLKASFTEGPTQGTASNANWAPLGRDRPTSPVATMDRSDRGPSESSRYSANGASPPSHPRAFSSRVSPRNSFQQPLPGSKPPTGPRSNAAPWPVRGRANSASGPGPAGRGGQPPGAASSDAIYGGGFGTAGSGGSSYRPTSGGRGDGPPPAARASQPPSGPRALQGGAGFPPPSRGRGRHEGAPSGPPRDRGWGGRGGRGGRGRGGRDFDDRDGYRGGYH